MICDKHNCDKICKERFVKNKIRKENICPLCDKERIKIYKLKNHEKILNDARIYRNKNKDRINSNRKNKYKESSKKYLLKNKIKILKQIQIRKKIRRATDYSYRLRENISSGIRNAIKYLNFSKNKNSFLKHVNWTIKDLKEHIEKQFEPWMNWSNWGTYNSKTWNDNDSSTWTWNIDHIIPQSKLLYFSIEDENFKKCWALENLRPYSAKQNILDGALKSRNK